MPDMLAEVLADAAQGKPRATRQHVLDGSLEGTTGRCSRVSTYDERRVVMWERP
jgi:hypothetical protein